MNLVYHIRRMWNKWRYRNIRIGKNSRIAVGTKINRPDRMEIGDNSYINGGVFSIGDNSRITIGNDCLISYNVHMRTMSHNYTDKSKLIREQGEFEKDITIEDDVWVGFGVQIMPGVTLHKGCVVGAGAVVTKDIASYCVVGGVPAKLIKCRS